MTKRFRSYDESHRTVCGVKQKLCCRCKKWKDESLFHRNHRSKDGMQWKCKECESKYARKRYNRIRKTGRKNLRYEQRHRIVKGVKQKLCRKCSKWKDETEFYKARSIKDGLDGRCQKCSYKPAKKSRKKRSAVKD